MRARWFVRGDLDGFFGLALDNLVQMLLIVALGKAVGFGDALLYGRIFPAVGLSLLVGNLFYAWQGMQLARREGRADVCALPYGINTVSLIVFVFLVMLPVHIEVLQRTGDEALAADAAWKAGLAACLGSGLIELFGAFAVARLRKFVPRAALLSTLAGIALTFISLDFLFRTYAHPIVGLSTFAVVCLIYFGRVRFKGGVPGGAVAVALGALLCWITGVTSASGAPADEIALRAPQPAVGAVLGALDYLGDYVSVVFAMGLFNLLGSLQNLESAEAAGDRYPTRPSLAANGIGTLVACAFGSCFPTTIYIGHPGWKGLGARLGYSWLNGAFMTVVALTGTVGWIAWAVPIEAGMAIVLWIAIVITAQAFQATPRAHAPAVVIGLLPGVAAWSAFMLKLGVRVTGTAFDASLGVTFGRWNVHHEGVFALAEGAIFTAMILSAAVVGVIEGRFRLAAAWCLAAAVLSWFGLMHGWRWTGSDTALALGFDVARGAALGYAIMGAVFFVAPWVTDRSGPPEPAP